MSINIVLFEPEIPQNTGNIARSCAATGAKLHLIGPLGFSIDDKHLKRAGLDYWDKVDMAYYENMNGFLLKNNDKKMIFSTKRAPRTYSEAAFTDDCYIVFGKETKGLPEALLREHIDQCIRIPMLENIRSLNLSNSVAIVLYEALRQLGFPGLLKQSHF